MCQARSLNQSQNPGPLHGPAEAGFQRHRQGEGRYRVRDEHHQRTRHVESLPVPQRLCYSERYAHEVRQDERAQPEPQRHGNARFYLPPRRLRRFAVGFGAHSAALVHEPRPILRQERLVEAVFLFEGLALLFRHFACGGHGRGGRSADAAHGVELHFHRAAGQKARKQEAHRRDAQKSGKHQQHASCEI